MFSVLTTMTMHVLKTYLSPGKMDNNAARNYWANLGSVHLMPIMSGWTKAVWNTKFVLDFHK